MFWVTLNAFSGKSRRSFVAGVLKLRVSRLSDIGGTASWVIFMALWNPQKINKTKKSHRVDANRFKAAIVLSFFFQHVCCKLDPKVENKSKIASTVSCSLKCSHLGGSSRLCCFYCHTNNSLLFHKHDYSSNRGRGVMYQTQANRC